VLFDNYTGEGSRATLGFDVPDAGLYAVAAFTRGPDYGIVDLAVDAPSPADATPTVRRMSMTSQHAIAEPLPERRRLTREDVVTVSEVAELLAMPCSTVYDLARRGELPCARLGRTIRFLRDDIEARLRTG
jgi:excisionase family DNA binding protein